MAFGAAGVAKSALEQADIIALTAARSSLTAEARARAALRVASKEKKRRRLRPGAIPRRLPSRGLRERVDGADGGEPSYSANYSEDGKAVDIGDGDGDAV